MASRLRRIGARLVLLSAVLTVAAYGATLTFTSGTNDVGTDTSNFSNWLITGAGATNATAVQDSTLAPGCCISVSNNGGATGTFISGGSAASFDGFWEAVLSFTLPVGLGSTYSVALDFSALGADDRAVLELNGTTIGNEGINGPGAGSMSLTDTASTPYTFTQVTSGTITSGLVVGTNTLDLIVNNTGSGITGGLQALGAGLTGAGFTGSVVLTPLFSGVPEPASFSYLLFGLAPLALGLARRRSR